MKIKLKLQAADKVDHVFMGMGPVQGLTKCNTFTFHHGNAN